MKKSVLPIVIFVFIVLTGAAVIVLGKEIVGHSSTDNVIVTPPPQISLTRYLVPVSSYSNMNGAISYDDLLKSDLCAITGSIELVNNIIPGADVDYVAEADLPAALSAGQICLLPPDKIDYKYQTLTLNNVYFWAKDADLANYPLKYTITVDATSGLEAEAAANEKLTAASDRFRIFAGGEIIPARAVDRLALNKNNNYTYMFDYFRKDIESADLAVALLEDPINGNPAPCTGCMSFVGDEQNAAGFKTVGFDILSLAGNHAGDGGQAGYARTIKVLNDQGILTTGTGNTDNAKLTPAITTVNGFRIGVIAADTVANYYWNKNSTAYGTNWFSNATNGDINWDRVKSVKALKENYQLDYLITYMSWGVEYTSGANNFQEELAHGLIDNGVDLILASHPHWVENVEFYKGKAIFFSLGNFLFDQNHTDPTREAIALNLYFVGLDLKGIQIMPFISCGPFITSNDITNKYLSGEIDRTYLDTHDETKGCVYFQLKRLTTENKHYKLIWDRLLSHSSIIK